MRKPGRTNNVPGLRPTKIFHILLLCILSLTACLPPVPLAATPTGALPSPSPSQPAATRSPAVSPPPSVRPPTATPQPTPTLAFGPSQDPVIFADPSGRVLRLDLTSGEQTPLSEAGIYQPGDRLQAYPFGQIPAAWTPVLSPDEHTLALPDPAGSGTWLVDLDGEEAARRLIESPVAVSWSPDGQTIAWVNSTHLYLQDLSGGEPRELAAIDGLRNVAWSPQGQSIAVASRGEGKQQVTLSRVDTQTGAVSKLVSARAMTEVGGGFDLAWTADGSEIWYAPAMVAYAVQEQAVHTLLSPYVTTGQRETMYALSATPDQQRYAAMGWSSQEQKITRRSLTIEEGMFFGNQKQITFEQDWAAYAWTEEGQNLVVQEGSGEQARLWRIDPEVNAPLYEYMAVDAGAVFGPGHLIGTRSHLAQYHHQVAPATELTAMQPYSPEATDQWSRIPMQEARLEVEYPVFWNFNWPGMGDVASTVSNFEMISGYYLASLSPEWFYAHFDQFTPAQGDVQAFLNEAIFAPEANAEWQEITIDGRTGYRVRWKDRPTHEEVYVPFDDQVIVRIQKYPLHSNHDEVFERMLRTATWLAEEVWAPETYPTPTPNPAHMAVEQLQPVAELSPPHWRDPLALVAVTAQGEIARATTTRLAFYDPVTLEVTRTGLVILTPDRMVNTINGDGSLLARVVGDTVEILDLNGLNEQGDPPLLGSFQPAFDVVVNLSFSPDGKTLAVVSQAVRDDIGTALLQVFDMNRLRAYGEWEVENPPNLHFAPDSRRLASWMTAGTAAITVYLLDPDGASATSFTFDRQAGWESLAFSADSQTLAAAAASGEIVFWNVQDGRLTGTWSIQPHTSAVSDIAYGPDGNSLALSSPDGVELRQTGDGSLAGYSERLVYWMAFAQRGETSFLTGLDSNGAVIVWVMETKVP